MSGLRDAWRMARLLKSPKWRPDYFSIGAFLFVVACWAAVGYTAYVAWTVVEQVFFGG